MKQRTKKEITNKAEELWETSTIIVTMYESSVRIKVQKMYDFPDLKFSQLKSLSEFFDTENINDADRFSSRGCDTCDYGSCYGFELTIT